MFRYVNRDLIYIMNNDHLNNIDKSEVFNISVLKCVFTLYLPLIFHKRVREISKRARQRSTSTKMSFLRTQIKLSTTLPNL